MSVAAKGSKDSLKVALGFLTLLGGSIMLVKGKNGKTSGSDYASSEKPQVLRGEPIRNLAQEKALVEQSIKEGKLK